MRLRTFVASLAVALSGALTVTTAAAAAPIGPGNKIIYGEPVAAASWAAAVDVSRHFACSGTLIAPQWVLTAHHCLAGPVGVRVGTVMRSSGGQYKQVFEIKRAPQADVALLKLSSPATGPFMQVAWSLPPLGTVVDIYGWGRTCFSDCPPSEQLKTAKVEVTRLEGLGSRDTYGGPGIRSEAVSGAAWRGDSGGPMVYNGAQVGVLSTADGGGTQTYASLYAHRYWIYQVTGV